MSSRAKPTLIACFVVVFGLAAGRTGFAESRSKQNAEAHYNKGMSAYTLGRFPEAIEEFEKAYEIRSEPVFLYNIAQSHWHNGNPQRAIFFYRRYLEAAPKAKNADDVQKRIQELQAKIDEENERAAAAAATPPPEPSAPPTVVQPPSAPVGGVPVVATPASPPPDSAAGRGLRIAGLVTAGVGVAGVAAGIVCGLQASSLRKDAVNGTYDANKDSQAKTYRTLEWVGFGVGGAAVVTGAVLYVLGASAQTTDTQVTFLPVLAPSMGGAALAGTF
jgi:tetratricopeptide (TPR) repeat protein